MYIYIYFILYTCKFNSFKTRCESLEGLPESRLPGCSFLVAVGSRVGDVDRENAGATSCRDPHFVPRRPTGRAFGALLLSRAVAKLVLLPFAEARSPGQIRDTQEVNFLERERHN